MKSLLASVYRRSIRLDNKENNQSSNLITETQQQNKNNEIIKEIASQNENDKLIEDLDDSIIEKEAPSMMPFNLNIKYIDDADTDSSIHSSSSDTEDNSRNTCCSQKCRNEFKVNILKELEKLNASFEIICSKASPNDFLLNESSLRVKATSKKLQSNETIQLIEQVNHLDKNSLINDIKICVNQIRSIFNEYNYRDKTKLKKKELNHQTDAELSINNNNKMDKLSKESLILENQSLREKINELEEKLKQDDEINRLKEAFELMRADRKRLKCERLDLLSQTKDLYKTLEAKENEIRDFLKFYEKKTTETSHTVKKLIDSKVQLEKEKSELQAQLYEYTEEKNELKLMIESKNACITKLQKEIFEIKSKLTTRYSLGKESDYGYASSKSSNTLSSSMIVEKTTTTTTTNIPLNNTLEPIKTTAIAPNKLTDLKQKVKKEERSAKCKSNDSFIYVKKHQYPQQNDTQMKKNQKTKYKSFNINNSNIANLNLEDNNSNKINFAKSKIDMDLDNVDLNKVLDSEAFIDLDDQDYSKTTTLLNLDELVKSTLAEDKQPTNEKQKQNNIKASFSPPCYSNNQSLLSNIKEYSSETSSPAESSDSSESFSSSLNVQANTHLTTSSISPSESMSSNKSSSISLNNNNPNNKQDELKEKKENSSAQTANTSQSSTVACDDVKDESIKINTKTITNHQNNQSFSSNILTRSSRILSSIIRMSTIISISSNNSNQLPSIASATVSNSSASSSTSSCSTNVIQDNDNQLIKKESIKMDQSNEMISSSSSSSSSASSSSNSSSTSSSSKSLNTHQQLNNSVKPISKINCNKNMTINNSDIDHIDRLFDFDDNFETNETFSDNSFSVTSVDKWTPSMIKMWLDSLGMQSFQIKHAINHIKTGKQLINMSDCEIEKVFLINNNQMHKRKLKLAIEDLKYPDKCKYPKLSEITNKWLCDVWLKQIGLVQFKATFKANLVDGRVLASLQRKDLEKYLGINKRHLQTSLLLAIELLRRYEFDTNIIESIRSNAALKDNNQLEISLWINEDFLNWLKIVNLQNFAANLNESGIHGALVIDNQFNVDLLYNCLKVNNEETKYYNMKKILEDEIKLLKKAKGITKPESVILRPLSSFKSDKRIFTLRGSLGRALGKKIKRDISSPLIDDDTYKRIEFSHKIVDMKAYVNN